MVFGWFAWFFMVPDSFFMVFNGSRLVFHGSSWFFMVLGWFFMVFHGFRLVFRGSWWVWRVNHGSRLVFIVTG